MAKVKESLLRILSSVAPMIGTAIGGPFGGLATVVLKEAFGGADEADIERQIVTADPEVLVKLRAAESSMVAKMKELDISETELHLQDRQDARGLAKATTIWPQLVLTGLAIFAFGSVLYVLVLQSQIIPVENKDLVIFLVGQLSTFTGMGFSFFLGTSKSSHDKNAILSKGLGG